MFQRNRRRPKSVIPTYIPKIVKSEPCLNERYGHLTEYVYSDNGKAIFVLADDKGDIYYRSIQNDFSTLKQMDAAYGKGIKYERQYT